MEPSISFSTRAIYSASPGPPFVLAESGTQTGKTTATVNRTLVSAGHDTTCVFQFVSDGDFQATDYTEATSVPCTPADLGDSFAYTPVSANLPGLTSGTTYHFRVVSTSAAGTTTGVDQTFTQTFAWAPFDRCPVDDPAMLAADGTITEVSCIASNSANGIIMIGNMTGATGPGHGSTGLGTWLTHRARNGVLSSPDPRIAAGARICGD